ncbi:hypothetical protein ADIMK_2004 [Marinobacterium lacunae]|uniref:Uncharacterized protein n=1 Tax=Marinobacterium lacunae TaxID=1232683 RepID=A0A081FZC2_9GAMM|nr:hypothetical protein ADIMK_2004 [Marinobacterium lacunae]
MCAKRSVQPITWMANNAPIWTHKPFEIQLALHLWSNCAHNGR